MKTLQTAELQLSELSTKIRIGKGKIFTQPANEKGLIKVWTKL
jgi:hypothetical protein